MACHPGVLEWAHGALEDTFSAGAFRALGAETASSLSPASMPPLEESDGLDRATREAAASVMAFYNLANPINLVALSALQRVLHGETGGAGHDSASPSNARLPPLPTIPRDIDAETRARMASLARIVNDGESALMPTALRHLANWPATISALLGRVEGLVASGVLDSDAEALRHTARGAVARVPLGMPASGRPSDETRHALERTIDLFVTPISRMIVIGRGFEAALRS